MEFSKKLEASENRIRVKAGPNYVPLAIDQVLRWTTLYTYGPLGNHKEWSGSDSSDYLLISQFFIIPLITLVLTYFLGRRNSRINEKLIAKLNLTERVVLSKGANQSHYFLLISIALIGLIVAHVLNPETNNWAQSITALIPWTIYLIIYSALDNGKLAETALLEKVEKSTDYNKSLSADDNDEVLVGLSEKLRSIAGKLEAYILESALFGALAFSGFLQIMAEDLVSFEAINDFGQDLKSLAIGIVHLDKSRLDLSFLSSVSTVYCLIAIETLICSILFLTVIASRLRFGSLADKIKVHIEFANSYNLKEEAILVDENRDESRLVFVNEKIAENLKTAERTLDQILPVTESMKVFRNGGILTFLIVLITSALLISPLLSVSFLVLSLFMLAYFQANKIYSAFAAFRYSLQYAMINYSHYILLLSLACVLFGSLASTLFQFPYFQWPVGLGLIIVGIYRTFQILIIDSRDPNYDGRSDLHLTLKFFWALGELIVLAHFFTWVALNDPFWLIFIAFWILIIVYPIVIWKLTSSLWVRLFSIFVFMLLFLIFYDPSIIFDISTIESNIDAIIVFALSIVLTVIHYRNKAHIHKSVRAIFLGVIMLLLSLRFLIGPFQLSIHLQSKNLSDIMLIEDAYNIITIDDEDKLHLIYSAAALLNNKYSSASADIEKVRFAEFIFESTYRQFGGRDQGLANDFFLEQTQYDSLMNYTVRFNIDQSFKLSYSDYDDLMAKYYGVRNPKRDCTDCL